MGRRTEQLGLRACTLTQNIGPPCLWETSRYKTVTFRVKKWRSAAKCTNYREIKKEPI